MRRNILVNVGFWCIVMVLTFTANDARAQGSLNYLHILTGDDGEEPIGGVVLDSKGNLYGTTRYGGASSLSCPFLDSCGTVFELSPNGSSGWIYQTLYNFTGGADGAAPSGDLVLDSLGNVYGTTYAGGLPGSPPTCAYQGCGTVFELSHSSGDWELTTLHSFNGSDGANPWSGVIRDSAGLLYGTTSFVGTVFALAPSKSGWKFSTLYSGGGYPYGGLTMDASGNLYGTVSQGGYLKCLSGTGCGAVFEFSRSTGKIKLSVLHIFKGYAYGDGAMPMGKLLIDSAGAIYGTTEWGGLTSSDCVNQVGCGTVFKLSHSSGTWQEQVLHGFSGADGYNPTGYLAMDSAGNLYGTTSGCGTVCGQCGTVFVLTPNGTSWQFQTLYDFSLVAGGFTPMGGITLDSSGNLFGTTEYSQPFGTYGTVFALRP